MAQGKLAGERCLHLSEANLCQLFGQPARPLVCGSYQADPVFCGNSREEAIRLIGWLEQATA